MAITVKIKLEVPEEFSGIGHWGKMATLDSIVEHWLEEGRFINEYGHGVDLPDGIEYKGFTIEEA